MGNPGGRYNIRVLDRAIGLLSLLSEGQPQNLTELSAHLGIGSSSTYRLLATLASHGYIEHDRAAGGYRLGLACLELSRAYLEGSDVRRVALPVLEGLRDASSETVHLGILDQMEVVYIEKLQGLHAIGLMSSRVGGRSPAYCTGLGKVLLAHLDPALVRTHFSHNGLQRFTDNTITDLESLMKHLTAIRDQGYAIDNAEHEPEVRCVAAPVFDLRGAAIAAISVSGPEARLDPYGGERPLIEATVQASKDISRRLGHQVEEPIRPPVQI
jgi:DNA-binding IclR family transcriptional regulator